MIRSREGRQSADQSLHEQDSWKLHNRLVLGFAPSAFGDPGTMVMVTWHLDRPLQVGPFELRNRIYLPAHQPGLAEGGRVSDRYVAYHRQRARAGVCMQVTGATPVARRRG